MYAARLFCSFIGEGSVYSNTRKQAGSLDAKLIHGVTIKTPTSAARALRIYNVNRERFEKLVEEALEQLPEAFRKRMTNVAIFVEDDPPPGPERKGLLLGLFHGIPLTERSVFQSSPPDRIFLYQRNIEAICSDDEQIRRQVRNTLLHELGHYFGLSEKELRDV